ncbi:hypothetical protein H9P43_002032 [Blastocladiella emersonii ATCC 22665]|nr:hypothetical protein H9P43_002032 [Blastocladiella emersonii ATCC 22665]
MKPMSKLFKKQIHADLMTLLKDTADMDFPLRLFAVLPNFVKLYVESGLIPKAYEYPSLNRTSQKIDLPTRVSFECFRDMFVIGHKKASGIPRVVPAPEEAIARLIGSESALPAALEAVSPVDVEQIENWLRVAIAHGLASWDPMLRVMYHFVKPEHLWREQTVVVDGSTETRKLRWFTDPLILHGNHVRVYSYQDGVRSSRPGFPLLSHKNMNAIVTRLDEWHAYRDQLARQLEAMALHGYGPGYVNGVFYGHTGPALPFAGGPTVPAPLIENGRLAVDDSGHNCAANANELLARDTSDDEVPEAAHIPWLDADGES